MKKIVLTLISAAFVAACGGPGTSVSIRFGTPGTTAGPSPANFSLAGGQATDGQIHLSGTNGALDIDGIWVIVEEFELEAVETVDCDDDELGTDDCEDFEREYFFIDVPLDGSTVLVVSAPIADGTYDELEFEVDDVEVDPNDPDADLKAWEAEPKNVTWFRKWTELPHIDPTSKEVIRFLGQEQPANELYRKFAIRSVRTGFNLGGIWRCGFACRRW